MLPARGVPALAKSMADDRIPAGISGAHRGDERGHGQQPCSSRLRLRRSAWLLYELPDTVRRLTTALHVSPVPRRRSIKGHQPNLNEMATTNNTRIRVPDNTIIKHTPHRNCPRRRPMTPCTSSPLQRDGTGPNNNYSAQKLDMRSSLRVTTWNVLTMAKPGYQEAVAREVLRYNISVAGITEARIPVSGECSVDQYTLYHTGGRNRMNGVALFLNSKVSSSLIEWSPISNRILMARLRHRHGNITILVVYAPTEAATENDKDSFYNQLKPLISAIPLHDQLLVLGISTQSLGRTGLGMRMSWGTTSLVRRTTTHSACSTCAP